jgi:phospholipid/cholesterol/gamma-HCH transport system substrate-binding protein
MNNFTKSLVENNHNLDSIITNIKSTSEHLSQADIAGISDNLKKATDNLNQLLASMQSPDKSSLGALMNSKEMYNELLHTTNSLHILLDDLRVHPKRYVNISVFGRKDKGDYLQAPLTKDTGVAQMQQPSTPQ